MKITRPDMQRVTPWGLCVVLLVAATGCSGSKRTVTRMYANDSLSVVAASETPRRFVTEVKWDTLMQVPELQDGSEPPRHVLWHAGRLILFSDRSRRLIALDSNGHEQWGVGPKLPSGDSLHRIDDLRALHDGRIIALDSRASRLVVVQSDGAVQKEMNLSSLGRLTDVAEIGAGRLVALAPDDSLPFAVISMEGDTLGRLPFPARNYAALHALARAGVLGSGSDGKWAFGFRLGNGLVAFHDTSAAGVIESFCEPVSFPAVLESSRPGYKESRLGRITRAALSMAVLGDYAYVLFGGRTADRGRIVDVYQFGSSHYAYSLQLPAKAVDVLAADGQLLVLTGGPRRAILRMVASRASIAPKPGATS